MTNPSDQKHALPLQLPNRKSSSSTQPPATFSKLGDWSTMTASRWHDAMYFEGGYFMQLWADTLEYTRSKASKYCGGSEFCTNVEVGSGTGDVILGMASDFRFSVGLDINAEFLRYSRARVGSDLENRVKFIQGSATELTDIMHQEVPHLHSGPIVVTCVNNTIGIFPDAIKPATYQQMQELAGTSGIVIVGFWNGNKFGDALQHFYARNPTLCGSMEGASIDWEDHTLVTSGGYRTHWSTPEEAHSVLVRYGFDVVDVTEIGAGVLCTCKGRALGKSPAPLLIQRRRGLSRDFSPMSRKTDAARQDLSPNRRAIEATATSLYENSFQQEFYREAWGGRNQHIGLYDKDNLDEMPAEQRVLEAGDLATFHLLKKASVPKEARVIDFGSGFGGTARYLAMEFDARVTCIDLSTNANKENRRLTIEAGLQHLVSVGQERSFFETGEPDSSYDFVISQDALCHAEDVASNALEEAARLLKSGGILAFTNIVVDPQTKPDELARVLARLKLSGMDSPDSLIAAADVAGFELLEFEDTTPSLVKHFNTILEVLDGKLDSLIAKTSSSYVTNVITGLEHWRDAGINGSLRWGFFIFKKN